jgi:hypothetical protein
VQILRQAHSGHWFWPHQLLNGKLAGATKQKQQANQHPNTRFVSCKTTVLQRNSHSVGIFSEVSQFAKKGTTRNNLQKQNFVVQASMYAVRIMSSTDAFKK